MTQRHQVYVEPQQVAVFLDKIARDRDRELENIETRKRDRMKQLRHHAFVESRRIHRNAAKQARAERARLHDRYVAAVNAKLRRRHWRLLTDLQQRLFDAVWARMMRAWSDARHQWGWCRWWLNEARSRSGSDPMQITLGKDTNPDVPDKIAAMLADYPGTFDLEVDRSAPEGIIIRWADHMLDGTLQMHRLELLERALRRITQILYPDPDTR